MELIFAGLTFGFLGSFHCVGMCGPIALSLPRTSATYHRFVFSRIIYNIGRIATYVILGAAIGFFSRIIAFSGYQQVLSITVGAILLLTLGWKTLREQFQKMESLPSKFISKVNLLLKKLFNSKNLGTPFLIGLLNGFLPCGFVYMALATALTFGTAESSILFMTGFGIGTVPAMLGISLAGSFISATFRRRIQKFSPYFIAAVGFILILRGLNLSIPFISPAL